MANYWIVVPRGNTELFDLLSVAFRGHTGFNVVVDRRGPESSAALYLANDDAERRAARVPLGPDEIVVAEQKERADCPATGEGFRSFQHVPVRRRRVRRSAASPGITPTAGGWATGAATVC